MRPAVESQRGRGGGGEEGGEEEETDYIWETSWVVRGATLGKGCGREGGLAHTYRCGEGGRWLIQCQDVCAHGGGQQCQDVCAHGGGLSPTYNTTPDTTP